MNPIVLCRWHESKRDIYDICETNDGGQVRNGLGSLFELLVTFMPIDCSASLLSSIQTSSYRPSTCSSSQSSSPGYGTSLEK